MSSADGAGDMSIVAEKTNALVGMRHRHRQRGLAGILRPAFGAAMELPASRSKGVVAPAADGAVGSCMAAAASAGSYPLNRRGAALCSSITRCRESATARGFP